MNIDLVSALSPLILGISGVALGFGLLFSTADRESKRSVENLALASISAAGGALVGGRGRATSESTVNVDTVENQTVEPLQ